MPSDGTAARAERLEQLRELVGSGFDSHFVRRGANRKANVGSDGKCPSGTMWRPSCKRRGCPVCGPRWARDWQRVLGVNLAAVGVPVATIAITGPGADVLPWDENWCSHRQPHKHAGARGCRVRQERLEEWCYTLTWRWQKLRQAARLATKRELGYAPPWVLARVWEPQKRGVPHLHLVVPFGTPAERRAAKVFRYHLARLAADNGFGNVQKTLNGLDGAQAARYLANYLAGRTGKKGTIRDNIADPRLPRSLLWLTPKLTRRTFVTMRTVRRARHLWAAAAGKCDPPRWRDVVEAVKVTVVFRTIYPKRAGPAGDVAAAIRFAEWMDANVHRPRLGDDLECFGEFDRQLARIAFRATATELAAAA
jgi:hypothetical protein